MRFRNLQELLNTLTEEERVKFKDLIDESLERDRSIKSNKVASLENLNKIKSNMDLLNSEYNVLVTQLTDLNIALEDLAKSLDKIQSIKPATKVFMYPTDGYIEE